MNKYNLQLVRPPIDEEYSSREEQFDDQTVPPIGLALIAARAREAGLRVKVVFGAQKSVAEVVRELGEDLEGTLVGATDLYAYHKNALAILKAANEKGATTVIGGPNVNALAERILTNRPFVDVACVGDGEDAVPELAAKVAHERIQNLLLRDERGAIRTTTRKDARLTTLFDLDDVEGYRPDPTQWMSLSSIRGCIKAERSERCSFCSIDHRLRLMAPETVWEQVHALNEKYGYTQFFETGDSFMVGSYPQALLAARPEHLKHIGFRVYASPDQLTPQSVRTLAALNVREIFIGIESIDDAVLANAKKGYAAVDVPNAIRLVRDEGMAIHLPFIYGLPGETRASAERTFAFAAHLAAQVPKEQLRIVSSHAIPFAGTALFEALRGDAWAREEYSRTCGGDLDRDDAFDYQTLVALSVQRRTEITLEEATGYIERTKALAMPGRRTSFGLNRSGTAS